MLDFGPDIHLSSRPEYSLQTSFGKLSLEKMLVINDIDLYFRGRKTRLLLEYDYTHEDNYFRAADTGSAIDTVTRERVHEVRLKWIERWIPSLRTELPLSTAWRKIDSSWASTSIMPGYLHMFTPAILIDWRIQRKTLRELRVQYQTGVTFYDGEFAHISTYKRSWDNKLDTMVKLWQNFFIRLLVNVNYLVDDDVLKYDMAELKATALF